MTSQGRKLAVSLPDTVLEERDSLREKTVKLGQIARTCSIYGVDVIELFEDEKRRAEPTLIRKVLEYLETPQYLRRRIYPLDESMKYAGLLPPLRIPSHKQLVPIDKLALGEFREGMTNGDGTVDIGLEKNPRLRDKEGASKRLTVQVVSKNPLEARVVQREAVNEYWGYTVETKGLDEVFSDPRFSLKIATSKYGDPLRSSLPQLSESVRRSGGIKLVFGSPSRGLFDMAGPDLAKRVDYVLNLFAEQQVETVRTEEAIFAGLNLLNTLSA